MRPLTLTSAAALLAAFPALGEPVFNRIASFPTPLNTPEGATSAEIISASEDGTMLVYTDSPAGVIGLVDITTPEAPKPMGAIAMGGEPTTAHFAGGRIIVGVNTSESFTAPSGKLVAVSPATQKIEAECDLGGQPDSVAIAPDQSFVAVAIENERDEDVNDGDLPQSPSGYLVKLPLKDGLPDCAALQKIEVTGLAETAPEDAEPEFVDINAAGEIALTMQENNHIVIVGADGAVKSHFSAGTVDLTGIDTKKNGALEFSGKKEGALREPDGVKWVDESHIVVANEGDWKGGARGFTIFNVDGSVVYESGASFEQAVAALGHYPEHRNKKGIEVESVEVATFGEVPMLFVAAERASVIGVYDLSDPKAPVLKQILPSGISPEGMVAIPERGLLASANEVDLREDGGAPAHVMLYALAEGTPAYPTITAPSGAGFAALSGLAADASEAGKLYAVSDSVLTGAPQIYTIDATKTPAAITGSLPVTRNGDAAQKLDLEGIALDGEGGFWLASEGNGAKLVSHALIHVDAEGAITEEVALPKELAHQETRYGFEGIAKSGDTLWVAVQREWGDDPKGMVKLLAYDLKEETWGGVHYPLEAAPEGGWMGLSELTLSGDYLYVVERDNQIADKAKVKQLTRVALSALKPAALGGELPVAAKEMVHDFLPDLAAWKGYTQDKVEGFAVDAAGTGYVVTDNDGTDDASGETLFWSIGAVK